MQNTKGVVTIACGNKTYHDLACNLAQSFILWNKDNGIIFQLVTDNKFLIPKHLTNKIEIIDISSYNLIPGFLTKLELINLVKAHKNLFLDADCLIYGDLTNVFNRFKGNNLSAIGNKIYEGKDIGFCKNISNLLTQTNIDHFPLICGSLYYFEKNHHTSKIFAFAKSLIPKYEKLHLSKLRNKENEEPLIAISIAKYKQNLIIDDGTIKADRMFYEKLKSNIIKGTVELNNCKSIPQRLYCDNMVSKPIIVHYNCNNSESHEYKSEILRLKLLRWSVYKPIIEILISIIIYFPNKFITQFKKTFRPFYRKIFGLRKIKKSKRT